ncbi:MAG TPA: signal recognition particle-docking protein FtsY [Acidobacteriota bacterium]|nr:signal recognition particle-docking protein FtsY [Acidobacteriota bacterium]
MRAFFERLKRGLGKTQRRLTDGIRQTIGLKPAVADELFEEIEAGLIGADCGVDLSETLTARLRERARETGATASEEIVDLLKEELVALFRKTEAPQAPPDGAPPRVTIFVGVNGAGKTTSIGKIGCRYTRAGRKVLFAAADTFRAAAGEQLQVWAERAGAALVNSTPGADPAAVAFDAVTAARARGIDEVLIDTAGRLQSKTNLMAELTKIKRSVMKARGDGAESAVRSLLVMDATTGQNGLSQAGEFARAVGLDGIVLTKLDGTAKGGIVFAIVAQLGIPVEWVCVGETLDDLETFDAEEFVTALFD